MYKLSKVKSSLVFIVKVFVVASYFHVVSYDMSKTIILINVIYDDTRRQLFNVSVIK